MDHKSIRDTYQQFAMAYAKTSQKPRSFTAWLDTKTQKCGLRHTVVSVLGNEYTGEWKYNKKHGKGTQVWKLSGAIYNGDWKYGKRHGNGTYSILLPGKTVYTKKYTGGWKNGKKHGYGTYIFKNSSVYEGEWNKGHRTGWGKMYYGNGDVYEGEWWKDKKHGQGIMRFGNGNWFKGSWRDDKKNGEGKLYFFDKGQLYEGFWVEGQAKCGTLSDPGRKEAPTPTKYPIPQVELVDIESVLREARSAYGQLKETRLSSKFQSPTHKHRKRKVNKKSWIPPLGCHTSACSHRIRLLVSRIKVGTRTGRNNT